METLFPKLSKDCGDNVDVFLSVDAKKSPTYPRLVKIHYPDDPGDPGSTGQILFSPQDLAILLIACAHGNAFEAIQQILYSRDEKELLEVLAA